MSAENVELVRRVYEAVARHDRATILALYHPEVVWDFTDSPIGSLTQNIYRGHDGLRSWWHEWGEVWDEGTYRDSLFELIDAGEYVVSVVVSSGRGRISGAEVEWSQSRHLGDPGRPGHARTLGEVP